MRGARIAWTIGIALWAWASVSVPEAAGSSGGEITRAQVSSEWTNASIAGAATRTVGCAGLESPTSSCRWIPFVTVGPGWTAEECETEPRRWESLGEAVQLVWVAPELVVGETIPFDLTNVRLIYGAGSPLLCLSSVEVRIDEMVFCVPESTCPSSQVTYRTYSLDSAILQRGGLELTIREAPPPAGDEGDEEGAKCRRAKHKHRRLGGNPQVGVGPSKRVTKKGKRVRRCKTG